MQAARHGVFWTSKAADAMVGLPGLASSTREKDGRADCPSCRSFSAIPLLRNSYFPVDKTICIGAFRCVQDRFHSILDRCKIMTVESPQRVGHSDRKLLTLSFEPLSIAPAGSTISACRRLGQMVSDAPARTVAQSIPSGLRRGCLESIAGN